MRSDVGCILMRVGAISLAQTAPGSQVSREYVVALPTNGYSRRVALADAENQAQIELRCGKRMRKIGLAMWS